MCVRDTGLQTPTHTHTHPLHMRFLSLWNEIEKHAFRFEFKGRKKNTHKNENNTEKWIAHAKQICLHLLVMMENT